MFRHEEDDTPQRRRFTRRAMLVGLGQAGVFGLIGARLFNLQVVEGARYVPLAEENRLSVQMLAPARGRILDRSGIVLADNREGWRAVLTPSLTTDVRGVLALFARLVPISPEDRERLAQRARRQPPNVPMAIASDLSFEQIAQINLFAPQLPGVRTEPESRRQYFRGATMGHIVGFVGAVDRVALDDDAVLRLPGMRVGKAGVERGMEAWLRGEGGHIKHEVDARGRVVRDLDQVEPVAGRDVTLTIDIELQARVLARLARERRAALVGMDVTSGEVLVMASVPTLDNTAISGTPDARVLRRLQTTAHNPMVNRAIRGTYAPGSTFKMVVALAALEAGVIDLKERIGCEGRFEYFNHIYRCWKRTGHGPCDLHRALKESCDVFFYEIARRAGIEAIARMARRLGLGQVYDCGLAHQRAGVVPDPEWKQVRLGKPWLGGETILAGIGQGYVLSTPLQLAVMTARLATGRTVQPTLVMPGSGLKLPEPAAIPGVKPQWLEAIRRAMHAVVNEEGGTGSAAKLESGTVRLAGKTGTSQVSRASSEKGQFELKWEERDHALFVGMAPSPAPRYAVAAIVEHAGSGGQVAGPLVREVMAELLEREQVVRTPGRADMPDRRERGG